jgi:tetratricopeptide (TPR) repeat protein
MTLLNGVTGRSDPDLIVQAASTGNGPTPSATLALLSGEDHGVLWSKDFDQPSGTASDLKQQLAATAARVLACALDGLSQRGERLRTQTLKTYLNACAQLSEIATADPRPVIPMLQQVTQDALGFAPAWGKLLVAQAEVADLSFTNGTPDQAARDDLARFIAQARMHAPGLAETYLAETALVPPRSFAQKLALIERGARVDGDNPNVLSFRAQALQNVGRMRDGVADAERAAQIDPLSPDLSCHYMAILAYSGLLDSARDQLAHIERLWPGTTTASNCRYEFFFRYGDPKVALDMEQSKTGTPGVKYLIEARADPTPAKVQRLVDFMNARKEKLGLDAGPDRLSYYTLAMATFHRHDELFDTLMHWPKAEELAMLQSDYFRPELHEFRKEPRFLLVMKRAGLLDYWRASGKWPDFCFDADMPYDCKAEAAKLR